MIFHSLFCIMFDRAERLQVEGDKLIWILVGMYNTVGKNRNRNGGDDTDERKRGR